MSIWQSIKASLESFYKLITSTVSGKNQAIVTVTSSTTTSVASSATGGISKYFDGLEGQIRADIIKTLDSIALGFISLFQGANLLYTFIALTIFVFIVFSMKKRSNASSRTASVMGESGPRMKTPNSVLTKFSGIAITSVLTVVAFYFLLPFFGIHTPLQSLPFQVSLALVVLIGVVVALLIAVLARSR